MYRTVRFGAGFRNQESYGEMRFGFEEGQNPTVRFGAVSRPDPHRIDRKNRTVGKPGNFQYYSPYAYLGDEACVLILGTRWRTDKTPS